MPTLTPTRATGARSQPSAVVSVEEECQVTVDQLRGLLPDTGLNVPFVVDLLSAAVTHERCGRHLYRSVATRTNNPVLKARYEQFGSQTEEHVAVLEDLIGGMGADPMYVSPSARAVESMDTKVLESTFMLDGSLDVMQREMAMLDAVLAAEALDHANWRTLRAVADELPESELRDTMLEAADRVEAQEDEHLGWANEMKRKMVVLQARSPMVATAGAKAEELVQQVRDWFRDT